MQGRSDVRQHRPTSFGSWFSAYVTRGLNTQTIGGSDPCHASPRFTTPCTHRGREGLLDVFQVVVVEYNVEPWVLRDGDGLFLSIPD